MTINEQITKIVALRIKAKQWRSETEKEVRRLCKTKEERAAAEAYVREQYNTAGAGFSGRFQ